MKKSMRNLEKEFLQKLSTMPQPRIIKYIGDGNWIDITELEDVVKKFDTPIWKLRRFINRITG